jgi:hypothetical protein
MAAAGRDESREALLRLCGAHSSFANAWAYSVPCERVSARGPIGNPARITRPMSAREWGGGGPSPIPIPIFSHHE